jgi:hypothetical protein
MTWHPGLKSGIWVMEHAFKNRQIKLQHSGHNGIEIFEIIQSCPQLDIKKSGMYSNPLSIHYSEHLNTRTYPGHENLF